ncbi:hypothetical protein BI364_04335 [Acidihalobacter yilgarnensis]|uniref:Uncharacterized protein n=1 Tax=Acidihalobacter yilgarnensis TaxID=2819280 RepID=A0A1D8ILM0_9GAMM|nr:hypothetical protein [Acidihalobacter yilgarnensis]AOU97321.1 hypothetical protein BI364_04335 [Acidihalobacter yilgarnensis]
MDRNSQLAERFVAIDTHIRTLEAQIAGADAMADFDDLLGRAAGVAGDLMAAYAGHVGKPMPETDDLLEKLRAFVKGDPSLNAVRDNVRELVYYRNCLEMGKAEALPTRPAHMAVRTARHLYLYLYTRCSQEHRLP